jgi:hypothetical protein
MALPVTTLAPRTRARASRSISSYRPAVRRLVLVLLLARVALLVLSGRVSANVVWPSSDHDRVDHRRTAGRRLDVVVTGSTDVGAGTVDQRRATILQGSPTVLPQEERGAVRQTMGDTLVVAGVVGLLGAAAAATFLAHSIARPVRRAVHVLQAPADGLDQHVLLVTRDELLDDAGSPTSAHVIPAAAEPVATLQAAAPGHGVTAPEVVEVRSVVPEIARVVREAAHKAAQQAAQEAAQEAATTSS